MKPNASCLSTITGALQSHLATRASKDAITDWNKIVLDAIKNGDINSNLGSIVAIQAITILVLVSKRKEVKHLLGLESKINGRATRPLQIQPAAEPNLDEMTFDGLHLDIPRHKVDVEQNPIHLTVIEFKLLTLLAQRRGRVQSREQLLKDVWEYNNCTISTRTVDTHIRRLRSKLGTAGKYIETIIGVGYRFLEN